MRGGFQLVADTLGNRDSSGISNSNWSFQASLISGGYVVRYPLSVINTVNAQDTRPERRSLLKFNAGSPTTTSSASQRYGVWRPIGTSPFVPAEPSWVVDLFLTTASRRTLQHRSW
jgi:hypothetical protein